MNAAGQLVRRWAQTQFSSLSEYNYRLFFFGQTISLVGTWMQTIGQAWLVLRLSDSAISLGFVTGLQMLPFAIFSLFGGVIADRFPKRRMLIILLILELLQALLLATLVTTGVVRLWHVYTLAFLLGCCSSIERPTRQSFFIELVGRERLVNAVALNSSIQNLSRIIGPAIGGLLIASVGVGALFYFNAVSFGAVLAGYMLMKQELFYSPDTGKSRGNMLAAIRDGLVYAWHTPRIFYILFVVGVLSTFGYNFNVIIPLIAEFVLHAGPQQFGLLTGFAGMGSLIAALFVARGGERTWRTIIAAAAAFSLVLAALSFSTVYWLSALLLFALGASGMSLMASANTTLQLTSREDYRGRVISIFVLLQMGTTPLGSLVTGWLSDSFSVKTALAAEAVVSLIGVGLALLYVARSASVRIDGVPAPHTILTEPTQEPAGRT